MARFWDILGSAFALSALWAVPGTAQTTAGRPVERPLALEDALAVREFGLGSAVTLSPDGSFVAYVLGDNGSLTDASDHQYDSTGAPVHAGDSLYITDTRTRRSVTVGGGNAYWAPVWSPDGRFLAFCSNRDGMARLWLWERATGRTRRATAAPVLAPTTWPQPPRWMPDSRYILSKILPAGLTVRDLVRQASISSSTAHDAVSTPRRDPGLAIYVSPTPGISASDTNAIHMDYRVKIDLGDLALIDVVTGAVRRLTEGTHPSWYMPSPSGHMIAYTENRGLRGGNNWRRMVDLHLLSVSDVTGHLAAPRLQQEVGKVSWSPDGRWLAYTQFGQGVDGELYVLSDTGGGARRVSGGTHASFNILEGTGVARLPLWNRESTAIYMLAADTLWRTTLHESITRPVASIPGYRLIEVVTSVTGQYWSPDGGRSMYVKIRDDTSQAMGFARVDLQTGSATRMFTEPRTYGSVEWSGLGDAAAAATQFVYVAEDEAHPPDLWLADTALHSRRRMTILNPRLDSYTMGASKIIGWHGLDGQLLHGALLLPAGYCPGRRYPLIVMLWGGESSAGAAYQFGLSASHRLENMQLFATRGYAVLVPDAPQSPGTPMLDLAKGILPGVNRTIELGIADSQRIGAIGHSYGGYSVLSLLVQTARFKAAVSSAAPANWLTLYGELSVSGDAWGVGVAEDGQGLMRATPWEAPRKYIENSPYFSLDRIQTPLLIVQGAQDEGVYAYNSDALFVGLRRLNKHAVYLKYDREGHFLSRPQNRLDYLDRVIAWFNRYLTPGLLVGQGHGGVRQSCERGAGEDLPRAAGAWTSATRPAAP